MKNTIKAPLLSGIFVIASLALFLLFRPGFCLSKFRTLTDDELIYLAVQEERTYGNMGIEDTDLAINKFILNNPNCCYVDRSINSLSDAIFTSDAAKVTIYYQLKEDNNLGGDYYEATLGVGGCGHIGDRFGTSLKKADLPPDVKQRLGE
jgi:hypothetical protein